MITWWSAMPVYRWRRGSPWGLPWRRTKSRPSGSTTFPDRIRSGNLQALVDDYSVVGVTTNLTIFAAAISGSDSYDDQVHAMAVREISVDEALRTITAADVRDACTGHDGRVSLEVSPGLPHDTDATAAEAAHLWWLVYR